MNCFRFSTGGGLLILQYHKVPNNSNPFAYGEINADEFSRLLRFLTTWFNFLPLDEAVFLLSKGKLPRFSAALTFDDGYVDWLDSVVPTLHQLKIPATFFITTNQLGRVEPFWHERIVNAVVARASEGLPIDFEWSKNNSESHCLEISNTVLALQEKLKYMVLTEREDALARLEEGLRNNAFFKPFTAENVVQLRDAGFQIGGHSKNHPILARCTRSEAQDEIGGCKEELESILREPVIQFAYPNGRPESDFNAEHIKLVQQAGYRLAVTTSPGVARTTTDVFQLPRFTPWARSNWRSALQIFGNMRVDPQVVSDE